MQRNKINLLQDNNQNWVSDDQTLKTMTTAFFSDLYKTTGHRDYGPILNQCSYIVTDEMNALLTAELTLEEVHQATF